MNFKKEQVEKIDHALNESGEEEEMISQESVRQSYKGNVKELCTYRSLRINLLLTIGI